MLGKAPAIKAAIRATPPITTAADKAANNSDLRSIFGIDAPKPSPTPSSRPER